MKIKLFYFDMAGRAEAIRMALVYAGVDFEDIRLTREQFLAQKETFPFGQVPVLEVDGKMLSQASAIYHYVGVITNLAGSSTWEQARVHEIFGVLDDIVVKLGPSLREPDISRKIAMRKELLAQGWGQWFTRLDHLLGANEVMGHCVGDRLSIADLALYCAVMWIVFSRNIDGIPCNLVNNCPNILKLIEKVNGIEKLSQFTARFREIPAQ